MGRSGSDPTGLTITNTPIPGGCLIKLDGVIDEHFDRKAVFAEAAGVVVVDLDSVRRITSYGVREWMSALKGLTCEYVCYARCRPAIVSQFNMVSNFGGTGQLLSFYAPYVCPKCNEVVELLIDLRRAHAEVKALTVPDVNCGSCGATAEFDDLPASYFAYAAQAPTPNPPALVETLLAGATRPAAPFKIEKEVKGTVTGLWLSGEIGASASFKRLADGLEGQVVLMMDGVTDLTAEGLTRLSAVFKAPGAQVFLARVPFEAGLRLAETSAPLSGVSVLSLRMPFTCTQCFRGSHFDLDRALVSALGAHGLSPQQCTECRGSLAAAATSSQLSALLALPFAKAPGELGTYLQDTSRAPTARPPVPSADATAAGQPFGRYQLLRPLGAGGMAEVFLARQTGVGGFEKKVVVKRILPTLSADNTFISMFLQEARVAARISHPNVVQIFDLGQVGNQHFIAMEYVPGWDLNTLLRLAQRLNAPFPVQLAARVGADICAGLHAAHICADDTGRCFNIVHRDVSPHNVLISASGQVKLTDFGIAKAIDSAERTPSQTFKGKISYMAPEQVRSDGRSVDARADIFPAGLVFFQMLTLEHAFRRDTEYATLRSILYDPVPKVSTRRPEVPSLVDEILEKALQRDPAQRYSTAAELEKELRKVIALTKESATPEDLAQWIRNLVTRAAELGQLPPDMSSTPSSSSDETDEPPPAPKPKQGDNTVTSMFPKNQGES